MKVVNPNSENHLITLISRYIPSENLVLNLLNKNTNIESNVSISLLVGFGDVTNTYTIQNGYLNLNFSFEFREGEKYRIKITENSNVIYRGKLIATEEETQNYQTDNNEYHYE